MKWSWEVNVHETANGMKGFIQSSVPGNLLPEAESAHVGAVDQALGGNCPWGQAAGDMGSDSGSLVKRGDFFYVAESRSHLETFQCLKVKYGFFPVLFFLSSFITWAEWEGKSQKLVQMSQGAEEGSEGRSHGRLIGVTAVPTGAHARGGRVRPGRFVGTVSL